MGYPINSSKDDLGFSINKNTGFFSSNRNGSDDIYSFDFIQANVFTPSIFIAHEPQTP